MTSAFTVKISLLYGFGSPTLNFDIDEKRDYKHTFHHKIRVQNPLILEFKNIELKNPSE